MIVNGLTTYFKSLSVGGTLVNVFSGGRKKTRLFFADDLVLTNAKSIELDATTEFKVIMTTKTMKTPAENLKVYRQGSIVQPKKIEIKAHIDIVKLEKINQICSDAIPVVVMCTKNMAGTTMKAGFWSDGYTKFCVTSATVIDEGYDNSVLVNLVLEEAVEFSYSISALYKVSTNVAKVASKVEKVTGANGKVVPVDKGWFNNGLPEQTYVDVGKGVIK